MLLLASAVLNERGAAQSADTASHRISGSVFDSTANRPLAGALVQLVSLSNNAWVRSTSSEHNGAFLLDSVPAGEYALGYLHPRLDSLQIEPAMRKLRVPTSDSHVTLVVPSVDAIALASCPETQIAQDEALFIGRLRPARKGAPATVGSVRVQWSETIIDRTVQQRRPAITATTNEGGAFVVCGMPVETPTLVQAVSTNGQTGVLELMAPPSRLLLRDLFTAPMHGDSATATRDAPATSDTADTVGAVDSIIPLRGPGKLSGEVRTSEGTALAGARVRLRGTSADAVTDGGGRFELDGLPLGTHALEAIAVGYTPLRRATDIVETDTTRVVFTMSPVDVTLDAVTVFGARPTPGWMRDFNARRAQGFGRFFDEAAIARRNPMMVSDLLVGIPGVALRTGEFSSLSQLLLRDGTGGYCLPDVVLDGTSLVLGELGIDSFVMAQTLVGVEVYRSDVLRPIEFPRRNNCGLIVLWTGVRRIAPD